MSKFMTKFFLIAVITFFCVNQSVCHAIIEDNRGTLEPSQLVLGYISITAKPADILNTYGHPTRVDNSNGVRWYYGKDFYVQFMGRGATSISEVTTTGNNGIRTADGISVGMSENTLHRVYGAAQYQRQTGNEKRYWYYGYGQHNWVYLCFSCTSGIIRKISLVHID